jgi:hypothetical protein
VTTLQEINAQYVESGPKVDWRELGTSGDARSDAEIVLDRFFVYAHGEMEWLELSVNWIPFVQTGRNERSFWSKRRLARAVDQLVDAGLVEDIDGSDCKWRMTELARKHFREGGRLNA